MEERQNGTLPLLYDVCNSFFFTLILLSKFMSLSGNKYKHEGWVLRFAYRAFVFEF